MADAFELLGLPARFDLEQSEIRRAHMTRVASVHPDASGGGEQEAAALNEARRVLESAERRANLLLERLGGPGSDDHTLPDGFLMEIMETRERIEAALASGDPDARAACETEADERRRAHIERVGGLFEFGDDPGTLAAIRVELNAWRYAERLIEQLDPDYDPGRADFG
ncbi:MAG: iron-sulfur cluster co-chaperone HscB C-terminal domain-containing protein [Planctomycetota bacterium]